MPKTDRERLEDNNDSLLRIKEKASNLPDAKINITNGTIDGHTLILNNEPDLSYVELEYIESTGTQYILPVEISSTIRKIVADVYIYSDPAPSKENAFLGCSNNSQGIECYTGDDNCIYLWAKNTSKTIHLGPKITLYDQVIHFEADFTDSKIIVTTNNTDVHTSSMVLSTTNPPNYLTIFAHNRQGETVCNFIGRIYSLKLYQDNTLKYDFIPVKRKKDNEVCLYDKVGERFYENDGTGSFIAGPEVN